MYCTRRPATSLAGIRTGSIIWCRSVINAKVPLTFDHNRCAWCLTEKHLREPYYLTPRLAPRTRVHTNVNPSQCTQYTYVIRTAACYNLVWSHASQGRRS